MTEAQRARWDTVRLLGNAARMEQREDGLAYAKQWRAGRREQTLTDAAINAIGLSPRAAEARFPYIHRSCAEWS